MSDVAVTSETMPVLDNPFKGMKRKRKRKTLAKGEAEPQGLNLTAMMDMMTILLVFLIQSFAIEPSSLPPDLKPPTSTSAATLRPSITITVSQTEIFVDGNSVAKLADVTFGGDLLIQQLVGPLNAVKSKGDKLKSKMGGDNEEAPILLVAHEDTPYEMLMAVLTTAGRQNFNKFRLQVIKKESPK
jgi:biopolymer transport protein ExbD